MNALEFVKLGAIAGADIEAHRADLPTYTELMRALNNLEWACSGVEYMENEYAEQLSEARRLLARLGLGSGVIPQEKEQPK